MIFKGVLSCNRELMEIMKVLDTKFCEQIRITTIVRKTLSLDKWPLQKLV